MSTPLYRTTCGPSAVPQRGTLYHTYYKLVIAVYNSLNVFLCPSYRGRYACCISTTSAQATVHDLNRLELNLPLRDVVPDLSRETDQDPSRTDPTQETRSIKRTINRISCTSYGFPRQHVLDYKTYDRHQELSSLKALDHKRGSVTCQVHEQFGFLLSRGVAYLSRKTQYRMYHTYGLYESCSWRSANVTTQQRRQPPQQQ